MVEKKAVSGQSKWSLPLPLLAGQNEAISGKACVGRKGDGQTA